MIGPRRHGARSLRILSALCLALAGLIVPTVARAGDPCFHHMDNRPPTTSGVSSQIAIGDCAFIPTTTRVPLGTTVVWRNGSIQPHEVVGSNLTWGAHDKLLQPGDTIGWTFRQPGVYAYSCMIHPGMTGAIIVGDAAPAAAAGGSVTGSTNSSVDGGNTSGALAVGALAGAGSLLAIAGLGFLVLRRRTAESGA